MLGMYTLYLVSVCTGTHFCLPSALQYDVNAINEAQCVLITPVMTVLLFPSLCTHPRKSIQDRNCSPQMVTVLKSTTSPTERTSRKSSPSATNI